MRIDGQLTRPQNKVIVVIDEVHTIHKMVFAENILQTEPNLGRIYCVKKRFRVIFKLPLGEAIEHGLSNGRVESRNTKIRLITHGLSGFKSSAPIIVLAMPNLGGHSLVHLGRINPRSCQESPV
jgi:hypothetical protein